MTLADDGSDGVPHSLDALGQPAPSLKSALHDSNYQLDNNTPTNNIAQNRGSEQDTPERLKTDPVIINISPPNNCVSKPAIISPPIVPLRSLKNLTDVCVKPISEINNRTFPNYVPCFEVENQSLFKCAVDPNSNPSPSKGRPYSEFTLDKSGQPNSLMERKRPTNLFTPVLAANSETTLTQQGSYNTGQGNSGHRSKSSSCLSLNFAWKKSYVAFREGLDAIPAINRDAKESIGISGEPLLSPATPSVGVTPVQDEALYTFIGVSRNKDKILRFFLSFLYIC